MDVQRGSKDSMKSTWRTGDPSKWTLSQRICQILNVHPTDLGRAVPVHQKDDKIPVIPVWQGHLWILSHAGWPLFLHYLYYTYTGHNLNPIAAFLLYTVAFHVNAIHEVWMLRDLGHRYGFFDGDKHERDQLPDAGVDKALRGVINTFVFRPIVSLFLAYRINEPPSLSWWIILELGLYALVLDFWFYWYHRCMHEFDFLWKYHRTHHLTKHPTPLLTIFADSEQELFDIAIIPIVAWGTMKLMGLPMGFYDWWICHSYVMFTEIMGHSGLRIWYTPSTSLTYFLRYFDAELVIEDHDLHHRKGYRRAHNYGKQTFFWDYVFGTRHERIESTRENVDWNAPANMKIF